jgi:Cys-tRNA(Pro)/Cys-tRNA(Cys) deacylase
MPARATPAIELVRRAGVDHVVHEYALPERHGRARDERPDYGLEAAMALGTDPGRMGKTLVVSVDDRLVAVVLPVDRQLDPKAAAAASGRRRAELASPAVAERAAGSVVGGISPLAPRRPWAVVVDASLMGQPRILVSAGRRGLQLELDPADLVELTGATVADICRPR